ncbi:uncharacterized protein LOC116213541 isoform X1 [Punica granatum]|uniref:Uncharacterized protein LOC116213541 isoform X1 n=1 Tax=Punica granatum TaxID=22663 RepID=A0A6P8EG51_PUNGR|nr:uncharacterized protein LOC116213541 isoform X1 [Punica granatum]
MERITGLNFCKVMVRCHGKRNVAMMEAEKKSVRDRGGRLRCIMDCQASPIQGLHCPRNRARAEDEKYAHSDKLERASDNLKFFKDKLLDYDSLWLGH